MTKKKDDQLQTPSLLAFQRSIYCSDARMWEASIDDRSERTPIWVKEKSVRGTISNRLSKKDAADPAKLDAKIRVPNLQTIDAASLSGRSGLLCVTWTMRVIPFTGLCSSCNSTEYQEKVIQVVSEYKKQHGFSTLARRYATNVLNARWLWRNAIGAASLNVSFQMPGESPDQYQTVDSYELSLTQFSSEPKGDALDDLASMIEKALSGEEVLLLRVEGVAELGEGQEVFPSQELILDKNVVKSKVLYEIDGQAAMHSQKIGNAIRTIDDWYPNAHVPIPVEMYGAVTSRGTAYRQPQGGHDFYTLLDKWIIAGEEPSVGDQHYVMACLIRGGVFGQGSKEGD